MQDYEMIVRESYSPIINQYKFQFKKLDGDEFFLIYCSSPSSRKESAEKVANGLIQATLVEQKRLNETGSYKSSDN
ncbi:MAG: hypothetical protein GX567_19445 [Clostridia bacterium]|nr:hypothetical protein [Clostridia bacterium]